MNNRVRVGVVGCGQIAQIAHIPYIQELPEFDLVAICDRSPRVLDALGEKYHVRHRTTEVDDLVCRPDVDAVLVTNKDHAPVILAALEAGKHVLVEKPLAFNRRQADEIIRAARAKRRTVMVAYMKRYDPAYRYALEAIQGMGKIHLIRMHDFAGTYTINNQIYDLVVPDDVSADQRRLDQEQIDQGMFEDIGPDCGHYLKLYDILLHLTVHDINVIQGAFGIPRIDYAQIYDEVFMNAVLTYPNGAKGTWESGTVLDLMDWDEQLWVYGKDRRVEIRFPFPYLKNAPTLVNINEMQGSVSQDRRVMASYDEAFKLEWRHFYDRVVNGREPVTGPEEARRDIEFLAELLRRAI